MLTSFTETVAAPSVSAPETSPAAIFETLLRYQHSMALKGAIDLDLFTQIAAGAKTAAAIAGRCSASERGVRILCDFLTVLGLLEKNVDSYGLTPLSARFLARQSPAYIGSIANFVLSPRLTENYRDVASLVRRGGTLHGAGTMEPDNELWVEFARSMEPIVRLTARLVAPIVSQPGRQVKILDIAAGSGMFGITMARQNPAAQVFAVDWSKVLEVAAANAVREDVRERYHLLPGSVFDVDLGTGYDLVVIPNFLHHFDPTSNVLLLKKVRAAMNPGGRVATIEFVPNEDRVSPPIAAAFSLTMLANTRHGDAYTFREFDRMFREAGFSESTIQDLAPAPHRLILTRF